jgi:hypothetical protein
MDFAEAVRTAIVETNPDEEKTWSDQAFEKTVAYLEGNDYSLGDIMADQSFAYTVYDILKFSL